MILAILWPNYCWWSLWSSHTGLKVSLLWLHEKQLSLFSFPLSVPITSTHKQKLNAWTNSYLWTSCFQQNRNSYGQWLCRLNNVEYLKHTNIQIYKEHHMLSAKHSLERVWDAPRKGEHGTVTEMLRILICLLWSTLTKIFFNVYIHCSSIEFSKYFYVIWNVTFCLLIGFNEHPAKIYFVFPCIPHSIACGLSPPSASLSLSLSPPQKRNWNSYISRKHSQIQLFLLGLCFVVDTISPFFQPQPQAIPTKDWHQTTCQEPFKIVARLQWHS